MDLSIIIVSYNTKELLGRCLRSINNGYRLIQGRYKVEIIVVDNGSKDGSLEYLRTQRSKIKLIENKKNLGFSKANNQALRQAQGEYILLLNSDTEVEPGCLEKLVEFAKKHPEVGVIGPRLVNANGSTQPSVYHFPTIGGAIRECWLGQRGAYEKYAPRNNEILRFAQNDNKNKDFKSVEVEAVVGAAMLIAKKVFDEVGLLDKRYFMYFEDLDFCRRVKRAGLKVFYLPTVEIIHHHGASGKEIPKETQQWLIQSSKIYHGALKHYLINFIIFTGQKWQRLLRKTIR